MTERIKYLGCTLPCGPTEKIWVAFPFRLGLPVQLQVAACVPVLTTSDPEHPLLLVQLVTWTPSTKPVIVSRVPGGVKGCTFTVTKPPGDCDVDNCAVQPLEVSGWATKKVRAWL